ncbi:MAG: bifunctional DNA-formamidopyrimidine glycosylase/DNA-(apurinic or apyrimidinic site) lyase [Halothermotrichaceae bacterium]
MPELPEVETIVIGLKNMVVNNIIKDVIIKETGLIAFPDPDTFKKALKGKKIRAIKRRGKYIIFNISDQKNLIIHLRMTGRLLVKPSNLEYNKHTHIIFKLDDAMDLRFNNVRKFGRLYLVEKGEYKEAGGLADLGPEPLAQKFTFKKFKELFINRSKNIKALLLDQTFLAGLGNIYTDEALFSAGINPMRTADSLNNNEKKKLYKAIKKVLKIGIKYGGTSFSDYVNASGEKGEFQDKLKVYQKEGHRCPECGSEIVKTRIAGRGTHYCPQCQK